MKICSKCKLEKSKTEFSKNKSKSDGLQSICKVCANKRSADYYISNKAKHLESVTDRRHKVVLNNRQYLWDFFSHNPCIDCGETDPIVLELDHVRGKKKESVSVLVAYGYSLTAIKKEIAKCEVRCANCHRKKTAKQLGWYKNIIMSH